jgi:hypothetical protein
MQKQYTKRCTLRDGDSLLNRKLLQKIGVVTQKIAEQLFTMDTGDRIPTIQEFSEEFQSARGTVQTALASLQDEKAVELVARGHLGTYIASVDHLKLLKAAGFKTMVGVMPLPYSKKYEGLATGICSALEQNGVSTALAFMRGSDNRLRGLLDGRYDFAVISQLTAQYYIDRGENIIIVENLGKFSYVGKHVLLLRENDPCRKSGRFSGYKVGIDTSSVDQKTLTLSYFEGKKVEYVPLFYNQIVPFLRVGKIDAAVWNLDDIDLAGNRLCYRLLDGRQLNIIDTEAAVICRKNDRLVYHILKRMMDCQKVLDYQKDVLSGKIMPIY